MNQTERIQKMEAAMDRVSRAVKNCQKALEQFAALEDDIDMLNDYYMDGDWRKDYEDDEKGKLPKSLKRGVLSQDGLFDLLEESDQLRKILIALDEEEED
jgi:hypothetical protein